jgi:outer membrane protein
MRFRSAILWSLLFFPVSVIAQTRFPITLTARAVWTDPKASFGNATSNTLRPTLDRSTGGGVALTGFFSDNIAGEVGISRTKSDLTAGSFALGSLQMTPVTATLQYHFTPKSFADVYAGAGGAYALFKSVRGGNDFGLFGYQAIDFDNHVGWLVNGGTNIRVGDRWGLNFDAKYMRFNVSTSARLTDGARTNKTSVRLAPLTFGAGVTFRF